MWKLRVQGKHSYPLRQLYLTGDASKAKVTVYFLTYRMQTSPVSGMESESPMDSQLMSVAELAKVCVIACVIKLVALSMIAQCLLIGSQ